MNRKVNHIYYYLTSTGEVDYTIDRNSKVDEMRYKLGNYFNKDEYRKAQRDFLSFFSSKKTIWQQVKSLVNI